MSEEKTLSASTRVVAVVAATDDGDSNKDEIGEQTYATPSSSLSSTPLPRLSPASPSFTYADIEYAQLVILQEKLKRSEKLAVELDALRSEVSKYGVVSTRLPPPAPTFVAGDGTPTQAVVKALEARGPPPVGSSSWLMCPCRVAGMLIKFVVASMLAILLIVLVPGFNEYGANKM
jgi:hypothetical protein